MNQQVNYLVTDAELARKMYTIIKKNKSIIEFDLQRQLPASSIRQYERAKKLMLSMDAIDFDNRTRVFSK